MFNYIITIHNSEDHLRNVLNGVKNVRGEGSKVYCVLDGCTDGSKAICDEFPEFNQIELPNIRETAAITAALKQIPQIGYNIILQDDVVLEDPLMELHVKQIYERVENVGVIGFRHGVNIEADVLTNSKHASETDIIQSECQVFLKDTDCLVEGYISERQVVYKSPICISSQLYNVLGGYDPRFEPIAHDDTEYCIRAIRVGYHNYVCAMAVFQPTHWGGTRRFTKTHEDNLKMHIDHMNLLRQLYPDTLKELGSNHPSTLAIPIWKTS